VTAQGVPKVSERSQAEQDLRATSDAIQSDAARLAELEDVKGNLDPSDPRVDQLSEQAYELAAEIKDKSEAERELSDELEQDGERQHPS
jgi:chromosome segregation ATPase